MTDAPQIYLVTPPEVDAAFAGRLASLLDAHPVACLRLALATRDVDRVTRAADLCREVAHRFDVPLVVSDHAALVAPLGLDGVHLSDPRPLRALRAEWGPDPIIGAFCGTSRHDGMLAGEAGADYVAFGPAGGPALGAAGLASRDLFAWWSEMIELPVVAEGGIDEEAARALAGVADFLALGEEVWSAEDPAARLRTLAAALAG